MSVGVVCHWLAVALVAHYCSILCAALVLLLVFFFIPLFYKNDSVNQLKQTIQTGAFKEWLIDPPALGGLPWGPLQGKKSILPLQSLSLSLMFFQISL